ncbi:hypothetical protein ACFFQF_11500 [Haladaptatus pallidirubidus]|uniref:hypothetical protein n=1 Tax=Haladaptatus pallidirubidus TaxID=1008152 RepID=UPI001D0F91E7|nr:hypothetical protein [Haladaptatus pallidirubidus]
MRKTCFARRRRNARNTSARLLDSRRENGNELPPERYDDSERRTRPQEERAERETVEKRARRLKRDEREVGSVAPVSAGIVGSYPTAVAGRKRSNPARGSWSN